MGQGNIGTSGCLVSGQTLCIPFMTRFLTWRSRKMILHLLILVLSLETWKQTLGAHMSLVSDCKHRAVCQLVYMTLGKPADVQVFLHAASAICVIMLTRSHLALTQIIIGVYCRFGSNDL